MGSMKVDERAYQELRKQNDELIVLVKLLKEQKEAAIKFLENKIKSLEATISEYKKIIFGSRSEKRHLDDPKFAAKLSDKWGESGINASA